VKTGAISVPQKAKQSGQTQQRKLITILLLNSMVTLEIQRKICLTLRQNSTINTSYLLFNWTQIQFVEPLDATNIRMDMQPEEVMTSTIQFQTLEWIKTLRILFQTCQLLRKLSVKNSVTSVPQNSKQSGRTQPKRLTTTLLQSLMEILETQKRTW